MSEGGAGDRADEAPAPWPSERDVLRASIDWLDAGHRIELVTVAATWGSSPRPPGSMAVVRDDGRLVGSVSGGCIERQLVEAFAADDARARVATREVADDEARRMGLTCGGRIELVFETPADPADFRDILQALERRERRLRRVDVDARTSAVSSVGREAAFGWDGHVLRQVFGPAWRLLLIGAGELSRFTARFAQALGYEVLVCDPRPGFADTFGVAGIEVMDRLPDEAVTDHALDARSAVLALTHDPSLDDLALEAALGGEAFHVGALGSRKSHAARCRRLAFLGVEESAMGRISAPVGLDIGSRSAAEIAVSIVAELVQVRAGVSKGDATGSCQ